MNTHITNLDIRKELNLNLKQFKNKISLIGLPFKDNYSYSEYESLKEFLAMPLNRSALKEIPYIQKGWYPFRLIGEEINIDSRSIRSVAETLNIELYSPIRSLLFISNSDKDILNSFLRTLNFDKLKIRLYLQEQTCIKKYGVSNPSQSLKAKEKISKKSTENAQERLSKAKITNLEKYGVENPFQSEVVKDKIIETNISKYGAKHINLTPKGKNQISKSRVTNNDKDKIDLEKTYGSLISLVELEYITFKDRTGITRALGKLNIETIRGKDNKKIYIKELDFNKLEDYYITTETTGTSFAEKEIVSFIKSIYKGDIIENSRKLLGGKEIDIYIPEYKVAIELNGIYWHSNALYIRKHPSLDKLEINRINNNLSKKHLEKTILCENLGIRLIQFWDIEWNNKKDICKSMIASSLGIYNNKFMARKLEIKEMSPIELNDMFDNNHIQGKTKQTRKGVGLFYKGECIQCLSFSNNCQSGKANTWELNRMVTKKNCQVVGGFSRLLKYGCKVFNINTLYSYISRRLFDGRGYKQSGFKIISTNKPQYYYIVKGKLEPRQYGMLKNFKKRNQFIKGKTENELAWENRIPRVYDCGNYKVEYIVETLVNQSHFNKNEEKILCIEK